MAGNGAGRSTNIEPGIIARVAAGVRYAVTGVAPDAWFGPQQPLPPVAQDKAQGRQFDYPVGFNLRLTPRGEEQVSFAQLRALADGFDLMRLAIETRKDQVEAYAWDIVPADDDVKAEAVQQQIDAAKAILRKPDGHHRWQQWLRMVMEELLVIDAVCVYPRPTVGGGLYGLELVDGGTIKRVLDDTGRTPLPPDPAYQQILKGMPAADYSADQLVYLMRNPRVNRIYGYSPVEQVITTVNIALRRQVHQLEHYTSGNVPEALAQVPANWTPQQIKDFQVWWDSLMEGNLAQRRKMRFVPSLDNIVFPKLNALKDEMDEWLARIVCFAFSISPSALIKQVNRASGEQMADTAKEEGLLPLLATLAEFITGLLQDHGGLTGIKFAWRITNKVAPQVQAQIDAAYLDRKVLTPDEVREASLGREPLTPEQREAAWPTPPALEMAPPGKQPPGAKDAQEQGAEDEQQRETPAEKMLAQALAMLDPERVARVIEKAAAGQAPRVVEVRPEVNVDVGDTVVHVPVPRNSNPPKD